MTVLASSEITERRYGAKGWYRLATIVLFGGSALLFLTIGFFYAESEWQKLYFYAAAYSTYLLIELWRYISRSDTFGFLSPIFLAAFLHFFLSYLLPILGFTRDPWIYSRFSSYLSPVGDELASTFLLLFLATFALWRGYELGSRFSQDIRKRLVKKNIIRKQFLFSFKLAVVFQLLYIGLVILMVRMEIYGFSSNIEARESSAHIMSYIDLFLSAGSLSLIMILIRFFSQPRTSLLFLTVLVLLIAIHMFAGALSGFKTQLVAPLIMLALARFIATGQTPVLPAILGVITLILAYQLIEPFRDRLNPSNSTTVESLTVTLIESSRLEDSRTRYHPLEIQIISRFDLLGMTTVAVDYVDDGYLSSEISQHMKESIMYSPILAFVPRLIWPNKPSYSMGSWFNQEVLKKRYGEGTSVAMGPIGFLYMTGGVLGIVFGFFLFGIFQSVMFEGIARIGAGGIVMYLSVIITLVLIPSSFGPAITGMLRVLPFAFVAQYILLRSR